MASIKISTRTIPVNTQFIAKNTSTTNSKLTPSLLLAHTWKKEDDPTGYWISEKLDGVRALWNTKEFVSRLGNTFYAPKFFLDQMPKDLWLDGELWGGRKKFSFTVSTVKTVTPVGGDWKNITFKVFDAPSIALPFEDRISFLQDYFKEHKQNMPNLELVEFEKCAGEEHLKKRLEEIEALGGEGLMLRRSGSLYVPSRSKTLLKVKSFMDAEAVVTGYEPGQGKYAGMVGGLWCKANGKVFCVGSGMSDSERKNPPPIGTVITYRYQEVTDRLVFGAPRFPTYLRVRLDAETNSDTEKDSSTQNDNNKQTEINNKNEVNLDSLYFPSAANTKFEPKHLTDHPRTLQTLIVTKDIEFGVEEVQPGSLVPMHFHEENDEVIFIFKGSAECVVFDFDNPEKVVTSQKCEPGCTFFVPKRTKHKYGGAVSLFADF